MDDNLSTGLAHRHSAHVNLGDRLRLGVLQPSVNNMAEPQMQAMLPEGVSMHCHRLKLVESNAKSLMESMTEKVEEGAELLADCNPGRILFHCTAVTVTDTDIVENIKKRITDATGVPGSVTSEAILAAFKRLGAARIVMLTPYKQEVNDNEVAFFGHFGVEVMREHGLQMQGAREFETVTPDDWFQLAKEYRDDSVDAYFMSCAQSRATEAVEEMEEELGKPVVTSNTAAMWHCLRESGIADEVPGFGTIFRL